MAHYPDPCCGLSVVKPFIGTTLLQVELFRGKALRREGCLHGLPVNLGITYGEATVGMELPRGGDQQDRELESLEDLFRFHHPVD
jgi:hypothetical protein